MSLSLTAATTVQHFTADVSYLAAVDENTGQVIADGLLAWIRPFVVIGTLAIALYFLLQKQFSKIWTTIIVGAIVFALTIGSGESSLIGRLASWIASWFGGGAA